MENEKKKFLGIYFECCNVYGRIYETVAQMQDFLKQYKKIDE